MTATLLPRSKPTLHASLLEQFVSSIAPEEARDKPSFESWVKSRFPHMIWNAPQHRAIFDALADVEAGKCNKLMFFLPPRHGKSETVTVRYSAYRLERDPALRVIVAAYNHTLASSFSRKIRRIARERMALSAERNTADQWETQAGGGVRAVGVGGGVTGMGGDLIIIDDPVKSRQEADSAVFRERVWDWYTDDLLTRREPGASMVLIMTRWHKDDLAGRILASDDGPNWEVLHLPALALDDDPLGREVGEPLWPERFGREDLEQIHVMQGDRGWWALYQGLPQAEGGAVWLADWWANGRNRYDPTERRVPLARLMFWDTAEEEGDDHAWTVAVVGEITPDYRLKIVDVVRQRVDFPKLLDLITATAARHNHDGLLRVVDIEYASSGRAAYQSLNAQAPLWLRRIMRRSNPKGSKVARAEAAASWARKDMILLPKPHPVVPWLLDYERELYDFPTGVFADQVDATSGLVRRVQRELTEGFRLRREAGLYAEAA